MGDGDRHPLFYAASKLFEAGFISALTYAGSGSEEFIAIAELTYARHEFPDSVRDEKSGRPSSRVARASAQLVLIR
jgi:hypothetical protein